MKRLLIILFFLFIYLAESAHAQSFVGSADLGNNGGTTSTYTAPYSVGSGTNRLLVVPFNGDLTSGVDDCTGVTFNGVSMTLARKSTQNTAGRIKYLYYLANPTSGTHNVVITCSSNHYILAIAVDYQGFSGVLDNTTINTETGASSLTTSLTVSANTWTILMEGNWGGQVPIEGTGSTRRVYGMAFDQPGLFDSNGTVSAGSYSMTTQAVDGTGTGIDHVMASFFISITSSGTGASLKKKKRLLQ